MLLRIPHGYRPWFHIWKLTWMRVDHVKDLRICHGSNTDLLQSATVTQGQVCDVLLTVFFNLQTVFVSICSRSGYVLGNICWHGSIRDATRTSRMGIQTIRILTDELRMRYRMPRPCRLPGKIEQIWFFRDGLGILSDFKHAATDRSMPLRVSQGHYGCPNGRYIGTSGHK